LLAFAVTEKEVFASGIGFFFFVLKIERPENGGPETRARENADGGVAASLPYMRTVCVAAPCPRHFSGPLGPESLGWRLG